MTTSQSPSSAVGGYEHRRAIMEAERNDSTERWVAGGGVARNPRERAYEAGFTNGWDRALAAISAPAAEQQAPAMVVAMDEGAREPRIVSWDRLPRGETWLYIADSEHLEECPYCKGSGVVDDGEINHYSNGAPYECGPVKCIKDCPKCDGKRVIRVAAPVVQAAEQQAGVPGDDVADLIAGGLGVSRAYAYEAMAKALNDSGHWSAHRAQQAGAGLDAPAGWVTGLEWHKDPRAQSEQVIKVTRKPQPAYGFNTPIYTADALRAKVEPSDAKLNGLFLDAINWGRTYGQRLNISDLALSDAAEGFADKARAILALQGAKLAEPSAPVAGEVPTGWVQLLRDLTALASEGSDHTPRSFNDGVMRLSTRAHKLLNLLAATPVPQPGAQASRPVAVEQADAVRLDWIAEQCRTSTVRMDGSSMWVAGRRMQSLHGHTFRDAIDAAMLAAAPVPQPGAQASLVARAPTGDELRALARNASMSASDPASPTELVLAGWRAAQRAAPVAATQPSEGANLADAQAPAGALPTIKGASIDGGYVIVTAAGRGADKARAVRDAILRLFPVDPRYHPNPDAAPIEAQANSVRSHQIAPAAAQAPREPSP